VPLTLTKNAYDRTFFNVYKRVIIESFLGKRRRVINKIALIFKDTD